MTISSSARPRKGRDGHKGPQYRTVAGKRMVLLEERSIIRHRPRAGLTQVKLARRAGIRPETLNRIEHATVSPSVATVKKIDRALKEAERNDRQAKRS